MMARSRVMLVAVVALFAFGAATVVGKGGEGGFVPVPKSTCYTCHATDTPSFQHMVQLLPPKSASSLVDGKIDYTAQVQNAWNAKLIFLAPTMDISKAPSLEFTGGLPPVAGNLTHLSIQPTVQTPDKVDSANTTYLVPEGVATLAFKVVPKDSNPLTAPKLTMVVIPPGGAPVQVEGDPGTTLTKSFEGADLQKFGGGAWSVGAQMRVIDQANPVVSRPATRVDFDVVEDATFQTGGLQQTLGRRLDIAKGGSTLIGWHLQVLKEPADGETVTVYLNSSGFYKHINPGNDNFGNYTDPAVTLNVVLEGERVALVAPSTDITRPPLLNGPTMVTSSEAVGYAASFLMISSIWSGGMFGKATRRQLNSVFGSAKRRVAFHNFLSYGLIAAALAHMVLFLVESFYNWTLGLIWGGIAILAMAGLGVTGALQVPMIRKWNYATWRYTHYSMTVAAILFTIVHMLLDGSHFGAVQSAVCWHDPLDPSPGALKC